jgi:hypothetical protein
VIRRRETFPALPGGVVWTPLSAYSATELGDKATHYRQMAQTASTAQVRDGLLKLAQRFDQMADQRDAGETQ